MVEEIGLSPGGGGTIVEVSPSIRESVCGDKSEWLRLVNDGEIVIEGFHCEMITDRTTPPFSPMRFQNYFFHVPWRIPWLPLHSRLGDLNSTISGGGDLGI